MNTRIVRWSRKPAFLHWLQSDSNLARKSLGSNETEAHSCIDMVDLSALRNKKEEKVRQAKPTTAFMFRLIAS